MGFSLIVRKAEETDISSIEPLCKNFFSVCGCDYVEYDKDTILNLLNASINQGLTYLAEKDGKVIGFLGGMAFPSVMNNKVMVGCEIAWWVEPEHRKGSAAIKLLKCVQNAAQEMGLATWSMMCLEELNPDGVESIYKRMGYKPAERTYVRVF